MIEFLFCSKGCKATFGKNPEKFIGAHDKFCRGCGTALIPACVPCGASVKEDANFCARCGAPVGVLQSVG